MSTVTIDFGSPLWGGGSGELASDNWYLGYVEDVTNGVTSFVSWITGTPAASLTDAFTSGSVSDDGSPTLNLGQGGTLSGSFNAGGVLVSGGSYELAGTLTTGAVQVEEEQADNSLFTIGSGAVLDATVLGVSNIANIAGLSSELIISGGTVSVSGAIGTGTLIENSSGTVVSVGPGTIAVEGASSTLTTANALSIDGSLSINSGASMSVASNADVGIYSPSTLTVSGPESTLTLAGPLGLNLGSSNGGAAGYSNSGTGTLDVSDGADVSTAGAVYLSGASSLSVDTTSAVEIGGTDHLNPGIISVLLSISGSGTINGDVDNSGSIIATSTTDALRLTGPVSGNGTLMISSGADLITDGSVASDSSVAFAGATGTLTIGSLANFDAPISGFQSGDVINVESVVANTVTYDPSDGKFLLEEVTAGQSPVTVGDLSLSGASGKLTASFWQPARWT